jgi:hypothetical protein
MEKIVLPKFVKIIATTMEIVLTASVCAKVDGTVNNAIRKSALKIATSKYILI